MSLPIQEITCSIKKKRLSKFRGSTLSCWESLLHNNENSQYDRYKIFLINFVTTNFRYVCDYCLSSVLHSTKNSVIFVRLFLHATKISIIRFIPRLANLKGEIWKGICLCSENWGDKKLLNWKEPTNKSFKWKKKNKNKTEQKDEVVVVSNTWN